jgi:Cu/Zn superoxide dismutase
MKASRFWILVALPIALTACGGDDVDDTATIDMSDTMQTATMPMDTAMDNMDMAGMSTIALEPLNDSGASGEAMIHESGDGLEVVVELMGAPEGERPGHIHAGTCADLGDVVYPLQAVAVGADGTGTSTSSLDVGMGEVADGQHVVNYHGEGGTPIACGAISMHQM